MSGTSRPSVSSHKTTPAAFITHAAEVATFYGFEPMQRIEREVRARPRPAATPRTYGAYSFATAATVCAQSAAGKDAAPALAFWASPNPAHLPPGLSPQGTAEFCLSIVGSEGSLSEILILKTLAAIIGEWTGPVTRVRLNALGDRDSRARFARELSSYLRRRMGDMSPECREALARDPLHAYSCTSEACRALLPDAPRAVNFLSEKSRSHFRDVLERLEQLDIPYELDDTLVGDEREPRVVFALDFASDDVVLQGSLGGRYDDFVRRLTGRKEGGAVSASIFFRKKGLDRPKYSPELSGRPPHFFFVRLGDRAALRSLAVLDVLRRARLPVSQSFDVKSLGTQLAATRAPGISYVIIMGEREALDDTVIVRSTRNSAQQIVTVPELPRYLKGLRA